MVHLEYAMRPGGIVTEDCCHTDPGISHGDVRVTIGTGERLSIDTSFARMGCS